MVTERCALLQTVSVTGSVTVTKSQELATWNITDELFWVITLSFSARVSAQGFAIDWSLSVAVVSLIMC